MSAMEHLVPEQMFSTEAAPANGISAVKAIQLAAAEGQRIYTITRANVDVALAQINLSSDIEAEIRNAAQAGLEITAHQQSVSFFGRPSVGYIILDPVTATGAYKIGGGGNGSALTSPTPGAVGVILSAMAAMVLADLPAAKAAQYQAALFAVMIGSILLLSAYSQFQSGNELAASILCNAGLGYVMRGLSLLPLARNKISKIIGLLMGAPVAYSFSVAGCSS